MVQRYRGAGTGAIARNLHLLWLLKGLESAWFPIPVIVLFYQSHGLGLEQAVMLKAILSGAIFLGEIPSGYLADRFGRKTSLISGALLWLLGWLIYCTQGSFSWFATAEILAGLGASLMSGADSAIAYDSLLMLAQTHRYRRWEGRGVAITGMTEAICGLLGAWVATKNLVYPFYLQTVCIGLYLGVALLLWEPTRHGAEVTPTWRQVGRSLQTVFQERRSLRWLLLFSATLSCGSFLIVWISQDYMVTRGVTVAQLGWAWLIFHGAMAIVSFHVESLIRLFSYRVILGLLPLLMAIAYVGMGLTESRWGIGLIVVIYLVRGCNAPLVLSYLNDRIPSHLRATLISVNSFAFRCGFIGVAAIASLLTRLWGLEVSLIGIGMLLGTVASYGYYRLQPLDP